MNERIRQLAYAAKLDDHMLWTSDRGNVLSYDIAKFAELIVQECLNQCYNRGMDDELYAGQLKAATYIEEYFGVEE